MAGPGPRAEAEGSPELPNTQIDSMISGENIARLFDISIEHVRRLARDGVIFPGSPGRYYAARSIHGYVKWLRARAKGRDEVAETQRARLTGAKAEIAEMNRRKMAGELLDAQMISSRMSKVAFNMRNMMGAMPSKLAPILISMSDPVQVEQAIKREINAVVEEFEREFQLGRFDRDGSIVEDDPRLLRSGAEASEGPNDI